MKEMEAIAKELAALAKSGGEFLSEGQKEDMVLGVFAPKYESWYTKALAVVSQVVPDRVPEFKEAYKHDKRREVSYDNYAICDYLMGMNVSRGGTPIFSTKMAFGVKMLRQIGIVEAALEILPSKLKDIRAVLRAELFDSDIDAARCMLKAGHLRAAGVVAGVVIESHLSGVCAAHQIKVPKRDPGISDYNEMLKGAGVYDVPTWRLIQRLGDIRNLCGHKKGRDPTSDEVGDLLNGTDKIIKEVF